MKQFIIRIFVALTMCGLTSVIKLGTLLVISPAPRAETIWVFRLIFTGVFSPLLFGFLIRRTSNWPARRKDQVGLPEKADQRSPLGNAIPT